MAINLTALLRIGARTHCSLKATQSESGYPMHNDGIHMPSLNGLHNTIFCITEKYRCLMEE